MKFLLPAAFSFAATIPIVVVLYLLKRKRVEQIVPSTLLWQKYLAETQASSPFQKLKNNWLLWLQLLFLLLLLLAAARPYFSGNQQKSKLRVLILDASASMKSRDVLPSRFEKARGEVLKLINGMLDDDESILLLVSTSPQVKVSATSNKSALRKGVEEAQATDGRTGLAEALKLAETLTRDRQGSEIHLFSDGAVTAMTEFENKGLNLSFHQAGERGRNVGIIGLDIRENPENRAQRAIYVNVANYSTNAETVPLKLSLDGREISQQALSLAPGETAPSVFLASQERDGVFTVEIDLADDLASDNKASIPSLISRPVKTLLVTKGNRFLEKALRAAPNVELQVADDYTGNLSPLPDIVALDNVEPTLWPAMGVLAFHVSPSHWFTASGVTANPALVDWKMSHPVLRYASMDNVQVAETLNVKTPAWAEALAESQQTPLILAGEVDRRKAIWVGFDNLQSTWPLRISFPIFIANAVKWLAPSGVGADLMINAGEPFRRAFAEPAQAYEVRFPDGHTASFKNETNSFDVVFGQTESIGVYHLTAGTNQLDFTVNLLSAAESNTKPAASLNFGKFTRVEATTATLGNKEIWKYFALAALGFLLLEWWYYHRRTA